MRKKKFDELMLDESNPKLDKIRSEMEEIQDYLVEPTEEEWARFDDDAKMYHRDFVHLYAKYTGTKKLLPAIKKFLKTHDIKRKEDFGIQFTIMWIYHIKLCHLYHDIEFDAEDIFRVKVPKVITDLGKT